MKNLEVIMNVVESLMEDVYERGFNEKLKDLKIVLDQWDDMSELLRERLTELYMEKRDGTGDP